MEFLKKNKENKVAERVAKVISYKIKSCWM